MELLRSSCFLQTDGQHRDTDWNYLLFRGRLPTVQNVNKKGNQKKKTRSCFEFKQEANNGRTLALFTRR